MMRLDHQPNDRDSPSTNAMSPPSRLDLASEPDMTMTSGGASKPMGLHGPKDSPTAAARPAIGRPFVGIQFRCCRTYGRVYQNADATAYVGHCPRCARRVT